MVLVCNVTEKAAFLVYHAFILGQFFQYPAEDGFSSWLTMCSYVHVLLWQNVAVGTFVFQKVTKMMFY